MEFKNEVSNVVKFCKLTITEQAKAIATEMKKEIIVTVDKECYKFDQINKLWELKYSFYTELALFLSLKAREIKTLCAREKIPLVCLCETRNNDCPICIGVLVKKTLRYFDKSTYMKDIEKIIHGLMIDGEFHKKLNNSRDDYLPIKHGLKMNLKTGEAEERTKEDYFTWFCNVEYTSNRTHADRFFNSIMPNAEEREYLRKILGCLLTGDTKARKFFVFYGIGSNGKSKLIQLMKAILQKYYFTCDKSIFVKFDKEYKGCTQEIADLIGRRCVVYSEGETSDKVELNMSTIKQISGEDEMNGNPKYKKTVQFVPKCKLVLLSNYIPRIDGSKASIDRFRVVFFDQIFSENPKEGEQKVDHQFATDLSDKYLDEVFSWIVEGSIEYYKNQEIKTTENNLARTNRLIEDEDAITSFLKHKIKITTDSKKYIKKAELFEIFRKYCNENSLRCDPRSTLYNRFKEKGIETTKLNGYDVYRKVEIIYYDETDEDDPTEYGIDKKDQAIKYSIDEQIKITEDQIKKLQEKLKQLNDEKNKPQEKPQEIRELKGQDNIDIINEMSEIKSNFEKHQSYIKKINKNKSSSSVEKVRKIDEGIDDDEIIDDNIEEIILQLL